MQPHRRCASGLSARILRRNAARTSGAKSEAICVRLVHESLTEVAFLSIHSVAGSFASSCQ